MKTVCEKNKCSGCYACINACPKDAIIIKDDLMAYNAVIDDSKCIRCGKCYKICHNINMPELKSPIQWNQGWAEESIRKQASSGGAASAIIKSFIESGGYVVSCVFEDGEFKFFATNQLDEAQLFAGSKYVKSKLGYIYSQIQELIHNGERVLFVGLPCQSAAIKNYFNNTDNLTTVDLICHGTPSPKLIEQYFEEMNIDMSSVAKIQFRDNNRFGIKINGKKIVTDGIVDSYTMAFLKGLDYTENCYSCRYATSKRVSDITLGDAWGQMSETEKEGASLILCQSKKGKDLVEKSLANLKGVNVDKAIQANHQLNRPTIMHPKRKVFFKHIKSGWSFKKTVFCIFKRESIRQLIKATAIKLHLKKSNIN